MKINKVKLVVGTLAILAVASTVGSISGTVAWWQNSYRATAELQGTSVRSTEVLEIKKADGNWVTKLTPTDITALIKKYSSDAKTNQEVSPITYPGKAQNVAMTTSDFYGHPSYQHGPYSEWKKPTGTEYFQFQLDFRVRQVGAATDPTLSETTYNLYLSDLTVAKKDITGKGDISKAVRVHLACGTNYALLGMGPGTAATYATTTHGNLDLNKDTLVDTDGKDYTFAAAGTAIDYGSTLATQTAYDASYANNGIYPTTFVAGKATDGLAFGSVTKTNTSTVTVTVFLEGWQKLLAADTATVAGGTDHALWDDGKTIGAVFDIGMTFEAAEPAAAPVTPAP